MPFLIFLALTAFVIILVGGLLVSLAKHLSANRSVQRVAQLLIACLTVAALIFLVLVPLLVEIRK